MARLAEDRGKVTFHQDEAVRRLQLVGNRASRVTTDRRVVSAGMVIDAAGAWVRQIGHMVGIDVPVTGVRGWMMETEPTEQRLRRPLVEAGWALPSGASTPGRLPTVPGVAQDPETVGVGEPRIAVTATQSVAGTVLLGATRRTTLTDEPEGVEVLGQLAKRAMRLIPMLNKVRVMRVWTGIRPWTASDRPVIGPVPGVDGFLVAGGLGGRGITFGPAAGEAVAGLVLGVDAGIDLSRFGVDSLLIN